MADYGKNYKMSPKKGAALPKGRMEYTYSCLKSDNLSLPNDSGAEERKNADKLAEYVKKKANKRNSQL